MVSPRCVPKCILDVPRQFAEKVIYIPRFFLSLGIIFKEFIWILGLSPLFVSFSSRCLFTKSWFSAFLSHCELSFHKNLNITHLYARKSNSIWKNEPMCFDRKKSKLLASKTNMLCFHRKCLQYFFLSFLVPLLCK